MVRSMIAGVAGLKTHQSKLDVIGNNIANVNTWGFKSSSFNFADSMYSTSIMQEEPEEEMLPRSDMELQPDRSLHRFRQALRRRPQVLSIV